ncbi:copper chaperone PCu(A)C [Streptomyces halobius]|uniref:Copper chaperone PCu(A)C n=1 Tax=Streptomyces halobius TaxID=2879846 RepID=A0ABY4M1I4_9ACTN|nr:copper chaperone PCu(A)C [Streptomyces halobius]UQA91083.1 copper chaperone PCu(A)C [Streptomyces halobius]
MTRRRSRSALATALLLTAGLALAGCSSAPSGPALKFSAAYMPQPVTTDMAGGYLVVTNSGDTADELVSVTSDLTDDITMHASSGDGMRQVERFTVPANGRLELRRGGNHLMLKRLGHKPAEGDRVSLKLHFAKTAPVTLDVPVEAPTFNPQQDHSHEH